VIIRRLQLKERVTLVGSKISCYTTLKSTTTHAHSHVNSLSPLISPDQPRLSFG